MKTQEKLSSEKGGIDTVTSDAETNLVPEQYTGGQVDAVAELELATEAEAACFFKVVRKRFLCVNQWAEIARLPMSTFRLTDAVGDEINRCVAKGDYIKIDIPGPGTQAGDGYEWVFIEELLEEQGEGFEHLSMRARPAANPRKAGVEIAHFLEDKATSTFSVKRMGNVIYAEEHGRNELVNQTTDSTIDNVRNTVVGWAAKLGFSYPQWKSLVQGWLRRD